MPVPGPVPVPQLTSHSHCPPVQEQSSLALHGPMGDPVHCCVVSQAAPEATMSGAGHVTPPPEPLLGGVPIEPQLTPGQPQRPSMQEQVAVTVDPHASICPAHCRLPSHEAPDETAVAEGQLVPPPGPGPGKPVLLLILPPQ